MAEKNKNKKLNLSGFLRYKKGEMTGEERNSFEKELQRDPFAEEAAEGLDELTSEVLRRDISHLEEKLRKRTSGSTKLILYSVAASIAVLMIISSVFLVLENRSGTSEQLAVTEPGVVLEITESHPVTKPKIEEKTIQVDSRQPVKEDKTSEIPQMAEAEVSESEKDDISGVRISEVLPDRKVVINKEYVADEIAAPVAARKSDKKELHVATPLKVEGTVTSAEDKLPIPGATISIKGTTKGVTTDTRGNFSIDLPDTGDVTLVASFIGMNTLEFVARTDKNVPVVMTPDLASLSEVVVVGYGAKKSATEKNESPAYYPPRPIDGRDAFDKYVIENIRRPDPSTAGQRVVVVAGFRVKTDGTIDSIRIIRSPDSSFSEEAIRLIRTGPAWKPAERDGMPVGDDVRVRIVFK